MGIITRGIPHEIVIELAKLHGSNVFVETGTYHGDTSRWATNYFETVHTIEREANLYEQYSSQLEQLKGVKTYLGNSRDVLPQIVNDLQDKKALYWLDGHWSGGETAGEDDECPLLDELASLSGRPDDIIMIDDARLFLCAPPQPHDPYQWPTISDIVNVLPASGKKSFMQIVDDVIFIIPDDDALKKHLIGYAQSRSDLFWEQYQRFQGDKSFFKKLLLRLI